MLCFGNSSGAATVGSILAPCVDTPDCEPDAAAAATQSPSNDDAEQSAVVSHEAACDAAVEGPVSEDSQAAGTVAATADLDAAGVAGDAAEIEAAGRSTTLDAADGCTLDAADSSAAASTNGNLGQDDRGEAPTPASAADAAPSDDAATSSVALAPAEEENSHASDGAVQEAALQHAAADPDIDTADNTPAHEASASTPGPAAVHADGSEE